MLTASLELDELYANREKFRDEVVSKVAAEISPLGIEVMNLSISELSDLDNDNRFFSEQKQRALQSVSQEVRVQTASSVAAGDVGEAQQKALARQGTIEHATKATVFENERKRTMAESKKNLDIANAQFERDVNLTRIEAEATARTREAELQLAVERARTLQQTERYRANEFSKVAIEADIAVRRAEAEATALRVRAEAALFAAQQEAAGVLAKKEAEAEGLRRLVGAAGGMQGLETYLLLNGGVLVEVARHQALAVQGMKPNVSVWATGDAATNNNGLVASTMKDVVTAAMPLFSGVQQQTGVDFLGRLGLRNEKLKHDEPKKETE